ncbi:hypothetical protein N7513_000596 [Penicillium frequentans]|nr:hypothetical protein N7513_000596 [Penicillium glabrum]
MPQAANKAHTGMEISQDAARAIMDDIRVLNGGLPEEDWVRMSEKGKQSYINLQVLAGNGIIHVAKDLYDADARFIFELIQNADDNKYSAADHQGQLRFLHFNLHHDRIMVESNEDGFSEQDLRAICSIHQSTKREAGGYVGHKGIGFKSVFKVAHKVHIQSGPFCFSLEHKEGESGLGMVTPSNVTREDLPETVKTRMTLFLASADDFDARALELKQIPKTILLFLRRLQKIKVEIHPAQGSSLCLIFKRFTQDEMVTLTKISDGVQETDRFITETDVINDLPGHSSRPHQTTAEATLAFPVDSLLKPTLEPQYVYSFLPMRREGFKFLIQSDFITQASRQGVHHCERNEAIRQKICLMFVAAIEKFCEIETLRFSWIEYLPQGPIFESFWSLLRDMIFSALRESKLFFTHKGTLVSALGLQYLSTRHCDKMGRPLLDDMDREIYLSPSYNCSAHKEILGKLGIKEMSFENILRLLAPYLEGVQPRFLSSELDNDWHNKVAKLLVQAIETHPLSFHGRIRRMHLIPSSDGILLSAESSIVYYPDDAAGHCIPVDLGIKLIAREALKVESRHNLFQHLWVRLCSPEYVKSLIPRRYNRPGNVTLQESVAHLRYLFWSSEKEPRLDSRIYLMDQQEVSVYRATVPYGVEITVDDLYFKTKGKYGTEELALDLQSTDGNDDNRGDEGEGDKDGDEEVDEGPAIHVIHDAYIHAVPQDARVFDLSWMEWLEKAASVRQIPRLVNPRTQELSDLFRRIADVDPIRLLGLFKSHQALYNREMTPSAMEEICSLEVPCTNDEYSLLNDTYYPSKELKEICHRAGFGDSFDWFLDIDDDWPTTKTTGWNFLADFGVGMTPDSTFFSKIFIKLEDMDPEDAVGGASAMYDELLKRHHQDEDALKHLFQDSVSVLVPSIGTIHAEWREIEECLWMGHPSLRTKRPLGIHEEFSSRPHVVQLFRDVLFLNDANLTTYLDEIEFYKAQCQLAGLEDVEPENTHSGVLVLTDHDNEDIDSQNLEPEEDEGRRIYVNLPDLIEMYKEVDQRTEDDDDACQIRSKFNENELVYLPSQELWVSPRLCVWAATPKMGKQYGISETYGHLDSFFQEVLHVLDPSAETYIEQLKELVPSGYANINDIEETMHIMSKMNFSDVQVEELRQLAFLPVRGADGVRYLARPDDNFVILNRSEFEGAFRHQVPTLDFSLEQIIVTEARNPASEISSRATRRFRRRAKHLYRCGSNYQAVSLRADPSNVFRQLQMANIYESEGFQRTLVLQYGDIEATAQSGIPWTRKGVIAPSFPKYCQATLGSEMKKPCKPFAPSSRPAKKILESVLNDDGIMSFSHPDSRETDSQSSDGTDSDVISISSHTLSAEDLGEESTFNSQDTASTPVNHGHRSITPRSTSSDVYSQTARSTHRGRESQRAVPHHVVSPSPGHIDPDLGITIGQTQYVEALTNVTDQARAANLSGNLHTPANTHRNSWNNVVEYGFSIESPNRLDRDIKVGAAGELYVFERLLQLDLPGFSRLNWKSTIRKNVNVHPDYHNIAPWNGFETADIVYHDSDSVLTSILINEGYLSGSPRINFTPTYYIEVKTTTAECETPFFMSNSQYMRMQSYVLSPGAEFTEDDRVYMIFRVSKVTSGNIGMKLYFDPEQLRQERRLIFTADTWSVRPPAF